MAISIKSSTYGEKSYVSNVQALRCVKDWDRGPGDAQLNIKSWRDNHGSFTHASKMCCVMVTCLTTEAESVRIAHMSASERTAMLQLEDCVWQITVYRGRADMLQTAFWEKSCKFKIEKYLLFIVSNGGGVIHLESSCKAQISCQVRYRFTVFR